MKSQPAIATYRLTLPLAVGFAAVVWMLNSGIGVEAAFGFLCAAVAVYLMAELNNAFALLRVSSRMVSTVLTLLLAAAPMLQPLQTGHAVLLAGVAMYFPLFASYQSVHMPVLPFLTMLIVGTASLFFPLLVLAVPVLWISSAVLRALSFRCWAASVLGLLLPYWIGVAVVFCIDRMDVAQAWMQPFTHWTLPDYTSVSVGQWVVLTVVMLVFAVGAVDFFLKATLDRTRTRMMYKVVVFHGVAAVVWLLLQPQHINVLLPLLMVPASITGGHFSALSGGKVQHIVKLVLLLLLLGSAFSPWWC